MAVNSGRGTWQRQPLQRHADDGAAPRCTEDDRLLPAVEGDRHERCVGAGDGQKDRRMIEAAHDQAAAIVPAQPVVQRRDAEHRQRAGDVDCEPQPLAGRGAGNGAA